MEHDDHLINRYHLFEKLGVSNDVELTHLAIRHHLTDKEVVPQILDKV